VSRGLTDGSGGGIGMTGGGKASLFCSACCYIYELRLHIQKYIGAPPLASSSRLQMGWFSNGLVGLSFEDRLQWIWFPPRTSSAMLNQAK